MGRAKRIIGSFVHAPERFDELAERIAQTNRRMEETDEKAIEQIVRLNIGWFTDQLSSDPAQLEKLNRGLSISRTVWGDPDRLEIDGTASVYTCFFNTNSGRIRIGRYTFAGSRVSILAGSHDLTLSGLPRRDAELTEGCDITIGNGVWLASGCTLLGPCTVGDNAVIAAGAVVIPGTEVPANTIWGGVPAKQIGTLEAAEPTDCSSPAVRQAMARNGGVLFADGWSEKSPGIFESTGHWLTDETGCVVTDRAEWRLGFRREFSQRCVLRMEGPGGVETIELNGSEGERNVNLPVKEGETGVVRITRPAEEKIYIALFPRKKAAEAKKEAAETVPGDEKETRSAAEDAEVLDIEAIMEEIRAEVRKRGPYEEIPGFDTIPKTVTTSAADLKKSVEELTADCEIPPSFPPQGGNPVKRLYKKAVTGAVRCATVPLSARVTETNQGMRKALEMAVEVIGQQQRRIEELEKKVEGLGG